jgi:hypothetical protein
VQRTGLRPAAERDIVRQIREGWMAEHCVQVKFPFSGRDLAPVFALEEQLRAAIDEGSVGEFDGNEVGGGEVVLYMYGPDADLLHAAIAPVLRASALALDGVIIRRYGAPEDGVREIRSPVRGEPV